MTVPNTLTGVLTGRYSIEREIGRGGMATVFLARDLRHDRLVALKVLSPELAAVLGAERFLAEIRVTAHLQHPNLLPLFDSGEADGLLFYTMPFVEGESLRHKLDREKQLPVDQAVRMAVAIAEALDYAHRRGVVHRDLKPENILLHEGQPLIADFGIALAVSNAGGTRVTQTGISLGTPQYMSPEQATGDRTVDARSDIYSLGALTFEMLAGEAPHSGPTAQAILARLLTETPRSLTALRHTVPLHVEAAVLRALEKLPADRYATAKEFAHALTDPSAMRGVVAARHTSSGARRSPWLVWGALAGVAVVAALGGAAIARTRAPLAGELARVQLHLADTIRLTLTSPTLVALSPAGDRMAVAPGPGDPLKIISLSDPAPRAIAGTEGSVSPAFSPDGRELAFVRGGTLYRVSVDGGTAVAVADSAARPVWGDRGTLFFRRPRAFWALRSGANRAEEVVPIDSLLRLRIATASVLPDETYLVADVIRGVRQSGSLVTIDLATGRMDSLGITGSNPRWSATGHLVYVDSTNAVVAVPFSARSRRITGVPQVLMRSVRTAYGGSAQFAISQRGHLLAIPDSGAAREQLLMVSATGAARPVSSELRAYHWMRISPDGRRAVFEIAEGAVGPWNLWTMDLASGILTRLTSGNTGFRPQAWTPDGRSVLYLAGDTRAIASRPADGTGEPRELVTFPEGVMHGSVDAAGKLLVVKSRNAISLARLDSAGPPRVLFEDATAGPSPSISPDGRYIAYTSGESGREEVYVRAIDGAGGRVRVSVNGGIQPLWNRAGTAVFYRDDVAVRRAGIAREPVLAVTRRDSLFAAGEYTGGGMTWGVMPDDQHFLMVRDRTTATYPVLVLNWTRLFDR